MEGFREFNSNDNHEHAFIMSWLSGHFVILFYGDGQYVLEINRSCGVNELSAKN